MKARHTETSVFPLLSTSLMLFRWNQMLILRARPLLHPFTPPLCEPTCLLAPVDMHASNERHAKSADLALKAYNDAQASWDHPACSAIKSRRPIFRLNPFRARRSRRSSCSVAVTHLSGTRQTGGTAFTCQGRHHRVSKLQKRSIGQGPCRRRGAASDI